MENNLPCNYDKNGMKICMNFVYHTLSAIRNNKVHGLSVI